MNTKQTLLAVLVGLSLCVVNQESAHASQIVVTVDPTKFTSTIGSGFGGEFKVTTFSGLVPKQGPSVNIFGGLFQLFCVSNDDIIFGDVYNWTISSIVVTAFPGRHSHPLSPQTAYLFSQFSNSTLDNYDYTHPGPERVASARALQLTIWKFEDALFPGDPFPPQSQAWFDEANDAVAPGGIWFGKGLGNVRVLNLTSDGIVSQSLLTEVPEPSTLALFSTSVSMLLASRWLLALGCADRGKNILTAKSR